MKKELDTILSLQGDLETVEKAIATAQALLLPSSTPKASMELLKGLQDMHLLLTNKVEALYVSLNVHDSYPDLKGVSLEFVRILLMARDLKMNIRKRAIGSFFEYDRLDQAVGGRGNALGTSFFHRFLFRMLIDNRYQAPSADSEGYRKEGTRYDHGDQKIQSLLR